MLEQLISSIINSNQDKSLINKLNIIIADNDAEKSAELTASKFVNVELEDIYFSYFVHPVKGLSNIRNFLLERAFEFRSDYIVFIDDDEYVATDWLSELVKTIVTTNGDAARGPVISVNSPTVSRYISCWFTRKTYPDNSLIFSLITNNLIIKRSSLEGYNVWFDQRFNLTGSEDTFFGVEILKKGAKIFWADNAVVYENIPESRANLTWLFKRVFRTTSTYSYILKIEKSYYLIIKKFIISMLYLTLGTLALIAVIIPLKKKYWGILKIAEGLGGLSGIVNLTYKEYKTNHAV